MDEREQQRKVRHRLAMLRHAAGDDHFDDHDGAQTTTDRASTVETRPLLYYDYGMLNLSSERWARQDSNLRPPPCHEDSNTISRGQLYVQVSGVGSTE